MSVNISLLLISVLVCCNASHYEKMQNEATEKSDINSTLGIVPKPDSEPCPTWMLREKQNSTCECGNEVNSAVRCDEVQFRASILDCYCMTHDEQHGAVVGKCFYTCAQNLGDHDLIYHPLPSDPSQLNDQQCGNINRDGRLCGRCKEGYSPLVYSYDLQCMNCTGGNSYYNWMRFTAAAFIPVTLFYLFVVFFQFRANSPQLYGYFVVVQAISMPAHLRILLPYTYHYSGIGIAARILATIYGIWNLDFFRTLYTNICLDISPIQGLALDYAIAFYPLLLIAVSCILIKLHTQGFRIIIWIWRPFQSLSKLVRSQWKSNMSMIDVIATFLLLSCVKLMNVSTDLLYYTNVYDINGTNVGRYLYYDASVEYFSREHLPYAIVAISVLIIFIFLPTILLTLYPMRCFQRFLNKTNTRYQVVETFVDAFQGCYKDGTENNTRDCRHFSALVFIVRMLLLIIYGVTLNELYYGVGALTLLFVTSLYAIFQPYKAKFAIYNTVEISMLLLLLMLHVIVLCINMARIKSPEKAKFLMWVGCLLVMSPLVYITTITVIWILTETTLGRKCFTLLKQRYPNSTHAKAAKQIVYPKEYSNHILPIDNPLPQTISIQREANGHNELKTVVNYGTFEHHIIVKP